MRKLVLILIFLSVKVAFASNLVFSKVILINATDTSTHTVPANSVWEITGATQNMYGAEATINGIGTVLIGYYINQSTTASSSSSSSVSNTTSQNASSVSSSPATTVKTIYKNITRTQTKYDSTVANSRNSTLIIIFIIASILLLVGIIAFILLNILKKSKGGNL